MCKVYCKGKLIWDKVNMANNIFSRFRGLMGKHELLTGEGLIVTPCNQVHTFFMRLPLDVLFITKEMQVVRIVTLNQGKIGPFVKEAHFVLEVAAGSSDNFKIFKGDYLTIE